MTSLEDKILGEKTHYYCSSSDEDDDNVHTQTESSAAQLAGHQWEGSSVNTGPKGVIKDWQNYKQFESQKRANAEKEQLSMIKKMSMTCANDDIKDEEADNELKDDAFLKEYMMRRMQEMMARVDNECKDRPNFGHLIYLDSSEQFLEAIDNEKPFVTIVCHIYSNDVDECRDMNGCLAYLAQHYPRVKFCAIDASTAGMSKHFSMNGVPALLVYKSKTLIANHVRLTEQFIKPFFAVDVEKFLFEHDILNEEMAVNGVSIESESKGVRSVRESRLDDNRMSDDSDE